MAAHTKGRTITGKTRVEPFSNLAPGPAKIFAHIVGAVDPEHFSPADLPLLESYCVAASLSSEAAEHLAEEGAVFDGRPSAWLATKEKADKLLVALAARLRICPQSRFDRLVAGSNSRPQPDARRLWDDPDGLLA